MKHKHLTKSIIFTKNMLQIIIFFETFRIGPGKFISGK